AELAGYESLSRVSEPFLRAVPAVYGLLLVPLPLFFADALGRRAMLISAVLLAFSPAFVFYSRYYIQEVPFVFFLGAFLAALWKYLTRPGGLRAALAGLFLGLAAATKETWVFALATAVSAGLITVFLHPHTLLRLKERGGFSLKYAVAFLLSFAAVWV